MKKIFTLMTVLMLVFSLVGCGGGDSPQKSGADLLEESNEGAQGAEQATQGDKDVKGYHIKFGKYYKMPTIDYYKQEVALLTALFSGIDADILPDGEFVHSASASAEGWSATLSMAGTLGETNYRDGVIPALTGTMEFAAEHSDGRSRYEFSGPFVLPFATLRPLDPDYETMEIGFKDVMGDREAKIQYYFDGALDRENSPPEDFWFMVEPIK